MVKSYSIAVQQRGRDWGYSGIHDSLPKELLSEIKREDSYIFLKFENIWVVNNKTLDSIQLKPFYVYANINETVTGLGQINCPKNEIYGTWKAIGSIGGYQNVINNVDSLKKIIHKHSNPHIYQFKIDGTYTYSNPAVHPKNPYFENDVFKFDEKSFQIALGDKKKAYKNANLQILFVDGNYMIITNDNNPHGDYTTLYAKQEAQH